MRLIIASNNANKIREIRQILGARYELFSLKDAGIDIDVVEDGDTFAENAIKKAEEVLHAAQDFDAALADDSGLVVDALDGAPGVYSARFAGEGKSDAANNEKLLRLMQDIPWENRTCRFACAVAFARKDQPTICEMGYCEGRLLDAPRGENGFGYDPLFYYEPAGMSFAEIPAEEKNQVSHRRNALENLKTALQKEG